jgi:hypothetical protein
MGSSAGCGRIQEDLFSYFPFRSSPFSNTYDICSLLEIGQNFGVIVMLDEVIEARAELGDDSAKLLMITFGRTRGSYSLSSAEAASPMARVRS